MTKLYKLVLILKYLMILIQYIICFIKVVVQADHIM